MKWEVSCEVAEDFHKAALFPPLLFILVMEGLSSLLKSSIHEGKISGIKVSRLQKIIHLLFVNDVLIMAKAP
jgi:hypothetical protein